MWSTVMYQARVSSSVPGGPDGVSYSRPCGHQQIGISQALPGITPPLVRTTRSSGTFVPRLGWVRRTLGMA
jgi:hypothetical protein